MPSPSVSTLHGSVPYLTSSRSVRPSLSSSRSLAFGILSRSQSWTPVGLPPSAALGLIFGESLVAVNALPSFDARTRRRKV